MLYRDLYVMAQEMLPRAYAPFSKLVLNAVNGCAENSAFR